jgi:hypothetical protein
MRSVCDWFEDWYHTFLTFLVAWVLGMTGKLFAKIKIQYSVTANLLHFSISNKLCRWLYGPFVTMCCVLHMSKTGVIVQLIDWFRLLYMHMHIDTVLLVFKILNSWAYFRLLCIHKRILNVGYGGVQCWII